MKNTHLFIVGITWALSHKAQILLHNDLACDGLHLQPLFNRKMLNSAVAKSKASAVAFKSPYSLLSVQSIPAAVVR